MSRPDKPLHQKPERPEFWDHRFREGVTPWDAGRVPDALVAFAREHRGGRRVLVPGCGSAHEVRHFAEQGFDVTAIDFSAEAIAAARKVLGPHAGRARHADFFALDPEERYDVIVERAFLCALPRELWPAYAQAASSLLVPGGLIAGFFFFGDDPKGPPFGTTDAALRALLEPAFERIADEPVADSLPLFRGRERWQVWRRR